MIELEWILVEPALLPMLRNAADVRLGLDPTAAQHFAERMAGWPGSDGSSKSPDTIWGMRIGETSERFMPELPTYDHDLDYRVIRRLRALREIDEAEAEKLRGYADGSLLLRLMRKVEEGTWILRMLRRRRALKYYEGVRFGGEHSVQPRHGEAYPWVPKESV